jgi:hypothetical protein
LPGLGSRSAQPKCCAPVCRHSINADSNHGIPVSGSTAAHADAQSIGRCRRPRSSSIATLIANYPRALPGRAHPERHRHVSGASLCEVLRAAAAYIIRDGVAVCSSYSFTWRSCSTTSWLMASRCRRAAHRAADVYVACGSPPGRTSAAGQRPCSRAAGSRCAAITASTMCESGHP